LALVEINKLSLKNNLFINKMILNLERKINFNVDDLPKKLKKLEIKAKYTEQIEPNVLPQTLESLEITNYNREFTVCSLPIALNVINCYNLL